MAMSCFCRTSSIKAEVRMYVIFVEDLIWRKNLSKGCPGPGAHAQPSGMADVGTGGIKPDKETQPSPLPQYRVRSMSLYARCKQPRH